MSQQLNDIWERIVFVEGHMAAIRFALLELAASLPGATEGIPFRLKSAYDQAPLDGPCPDMDSYQAVGFRQGLERMLTEFEN